MMGIFERAAESNGDTGPKRAILRTGFSWLENSRFAIYVPTFLYSQHHPRMPLIPQHSPAGQAGDDCEWIMLPTVIRVISKVTPGSSVDI